MTLSVVFVSYLQDEVIAQSIIGIIKVFINTYIKIEVILLKTTF